MPEMYLQGFRRLSAVWYRLFTISSVILIHQWGNQRSVKCSIPAINSVCRWRGGTEPNIHALEDVLGFIAMNSKNYMKTSMKTIKDRFTKAPYGFVEDDVNWLVARLFKRGGFIFYGQRALQ